MNKLRLPALFLVLITLAALLPGCATTHGTTNADARDRVLHVTENPPSMGYQRLQYHSGVSPALKGFLQVNGYPDFIIEDTGFRSRKIVMYYVKPNKAYLLTITTGLVGQKFDVSGPEPIGKQTRALFEALNKLERAEASLAAAESPPRKT